MLSLYSVLAVNRILWSMARSLPAVPKNVKTTVELPQELWRAAKIRAIDDRTDLRAVLIAALREYLRVPGDARKSVT